MKYTWILALMLTLMLSLALTACGKTETPTESEIEISPAASEELSEPAADEALSRSIATSGEPASPADPGNEASQTASAVPEPAAETSEPAPPLSQTEQPEAEAESDAPQLPVYSVTLQEFRTFVEDEKANGTDLSPYFLLPSAAMPGYELASLSYEMNGDISDLDGAVHLTYKRAGSEISLTYFIYTWNAQLAQEMFLFAATNHTRVDTANNEIYYHITSDAYTGTDYYGFSYLHNSILIGALVPIEEGLQAADVVPYLNMVSAM